MKMKQNRHTKEKGETEERRERDCMKMKQNRHNIEKD